jgi:hypothetical protein
LRRFTGTFQKQGSRNYDGFVKVVTPVKTGVQRIYNCLRTVDSGFRRNDGKTHLQTFYEIINHDEYAWRMEHSENRQAQTARSNSHTLCTLRFAYFFSPGSLGPLNP